MANELTTAKQELAQWQALLDKQADQMAKVLPMHYPPERMARICMNLLRQVPKLQQCNRYSVLGAMMKAATLGLEPDYSSGEAIILPFKKEATLIVGFRGWIKLINNCVEIKNLIAETVYANDEFDVAYGTESYLKHKPLLVGDRGEPIGAYALVKLKNGAEYFKWMSREELEKRQKRSPSAQMGNSPWNHEDDRLKMWQKTCIIELQKVIPKASENMQRLNQAAELEARAEAGKRQDFGDVFDVDASEIDPDGVPVDDEDELDAVASKLEGQEDNGNGKEPEPEPKQEATPNEAEPVQAELVEDKPEAEAETKAEENESGLSGKALENLREDVKHCAQNLLEREIISEDDWYEITSDAGCASGNVKNMTGDQLRAVEKALQAELAASQRKGNKKQKATAGAK